MDAAQPNRMLHASFVIYLSLIVSCDFSTSSSNRPGSGDFARHKTSHEQIIKEINALNLEQGEEREFRMGDFQTPRPVSDCSATRCAGQPNVTAKRLLGGTLVVMIETVDLHHGGIFGYIYTSNPRMSAKELEQIVWRGYLVVREFKPHWFTFRAD